MSRAVKVGLVILRTVVIVGGAIGLAIWEESKYNVLWEDKAEVTAGLEPGDRVEPKVFEIFLAASDKERILRVAPYPESGWGYPDFNIEVRLLDPDGNVVVEIPEEHVYSAPNNERHEYTESLRFKVAKEGLYTLMLTPLTVHIDHIKLDIRGKR